MSYDADPQPSDDSEEGGAIPGFLLDPVGVLRRRWKWMALVVVAGIGLSGVFLARQQPSYLARATVLVASQRISEQFFQATVENDQLEKVSAIIGELLSRRSLITLIEEHELYSGADEREVLTLEEKVAIMRSAIVIGLDRTNSANLGANSSATIFEITYGSHDPQKAADVTNALAAGFTDSHLRMRSRQARLTTEFLRRELKQTEIELARQDRSITEFKQTHRGELPSELAMNLGRLDHLQSQRQSLALQVAEAESRLATLAASGTDIDPDSSEALLRDLQLRYKSQRSLYTPDHPNLVSLGNQIRALEAGIAERAGSGEVALGSRAAGAVRLTLVELRRQLAATVAAYEDLDRRVALVPERQEELTAMEQRAEILRESHREFLRKVKQAELAEAVESAQQGERATILDGAIAPVEPDSSPLKMLVVLLLGSFGAACGIGVLLELVDPVIVSVGEIEQEYRLPVLGSLAPLR
ncbi:MAG: hypothetical protein CL908_24875 [Deltaproteobacteria bacterium]|nr:hypothetical protein [Deltaproteobacteria bacterium]